MQVFKYSKDGDVQTCMSCRWLVYNLYVLAETQKHADALMKSEDAGICGDCLCDVMVDSGYTVTSPRPADYVCPHCKQVVTSFNFREHGSFMKTDGEWEQFHPLADATFQCGNCNEELEFNELEAHGMV